MKSIYAFIRFDPENPNTFEEFKKDGKLWESSATTLFEDDPWVKLSIEGMVVLNSEDRSLETPEELELEQVFREWCKKIIRTFHKRGLG